MPWGLSLPCYPAAHRHSLKGGEEDERVESGERGGGGEGKEGGVEEGTVSSEHQVGHTHTFPSTYTDRTPSPWPCPSLWSSCSSIAPPSRLRLLRDGERRKGGKL